MAKFGKKYNASAELIDKTKLYDTDEAIALVLQTAKAKFDETVEIHIRLGVDSRHADQQVRKIAELKMPDLNASCVETAMSMVAGTARSMGVVVED